MPKSIYKPTVTHLALHPPRETAVCRCGVKFEVRILTPTTTHDEDDPALCLTCNRKSWSRLWNGNRPVQPEPLNTAADPSLDRTADSNAGEVVPIQRGRR